MDDTALSLTPAAQIIGGLLILFLGRRLFWVFVGIVGFFCGLQFGFQIFKGIADWLMLLLAILVGAISAGLAVVLQRIAVAIAGGFAGGMLALRLAPVAGLHTESGLWVAFIAGALLAAVMLTVLFDPMLILLSVITGALMIAEATPVDHIFEPIIFGICLIVGLAVQIRMYSRSRALAG
ncbi:MAG: DUF4203 domain-containing protein [Chthoniobacterales bacterium]